MACAQFRCIKGSHQRLLPPAHHLEEGCGKPGAVIPCAGRMLEEENNGVGAAEPAGGDQIISQDHLNWTIQVNKLLCLLCPNSVGENHAMHEMSGEQPGGPALLPSMQRTSFAALFDMWLFKRSRGSLLWRLRQKAGVTRVWKSRNPGCQTTARSTVRGLATGRGGAPPAHGHVLRSGRVDRAVRTA